MIKSHICKVPSAYTCLECNMTCEEAKLGQFFFIFTVLAATLRLVWGCCCFCCFVLFHLLQDRNYSSWQGNHVENLCSDGLILCGDDTIIMTVTLSQWLINNWFTRWICNVVMMVGICWALVPRPQHSFATRFLGDIFVYSHCCISKD